MSKFKRFLPAAGAIAGNLIAPGIGGAIGGALGGAAAGGGAKGALTGGLTGGAIGFAPQIGGFANSQLGLGLKGASSLSGLGGALGGAGVGALTGGGLKGALTGGLTGGLGGYLANGGLGDITSGLGLGDIGSSFGFGSSSPGVTASGLEVGKLYNGTAGDQAFLQAAQKASGIGSITPSAGGLSGLKSLAGGDMFLSGLSALNQFGTAGKIKDDMLKAQQAASAGFAPYQATGEMANERLAGALGSGELGGQFNFQADPGYQFRKSEGEAALARAQSARGGVFSGQALREAADLNQQLANQAYNEAFGRDLQRQGNLYGMLSGTAGRGQNAAGSLAGIYDTMGDVRGNARLAQANALTGFASNALGGDIIGYRADGTPILRNQFSLSGLFNG